MFWRNRKEALDRTIGGLNACREPIFWILQQNLNDTWWKRPLSLQLLRPCMHTKAKTIFSPPEKRPGKNGEPVFTWSETPRSKRASSCSCPSCCCCCCSCYVVLFISLAIWRQLLLNNFCSYGKNINFCFFEVSGTPEKTRGPDTSKNQNLQFFP